MAVSLKKVIHKILRNIPVESGRQGNWLYKKWGDGFLEMYGLIQVTFPAFTAHEGHYRSVLNINLPFSLPRMYRVIMNGSAAASGSTFFVNSDNNSADDELELMGTRENAKTTTSTVYMNIYVAGYPGGFPEEMSGDE